MGYLLALMVGFSAHAEYRVFELLISNQATGQTRTVTTTLDHLQYAQYYPIQNNEIVEYQTSWMCWENTSLRKPCPKPESVTGPTP